MGAKTSQLQIRVSPAEKAALKRLAEAAKMSVSQYVLEQALPSGHRELDRIVGALGSVPGGDPGALEELAALLRATPADDLDDVVANPPLGGLPAILQNQVAGMVEHTAHALGVPPPGWVEEVPPLRRPHFGWPLESLRAHQLRVTPIPFKKRGIFFDPASPRSLPLSLSSGDSQARAGDPEFLQRLRILAAALSQSELKVEFYLLGGAVLSQAFHARPPTAHVSGLFKPPALASDIVADVTQREGWPSDWLTAAIKEHLVGGIRADRYVELQSLSVFVPMLEYVLALKVAALRLGAGARALDDLRYVLRALNLITPEEALSVARRYFSERHLPEEARATLSELLTA